MRHKREGLIKLKIDLKYCGGCNPGYDRVAAVAHIKKCLSDVIEFVSAESRDVASILIVAGCKTACVDVSDFKDIPIWLVTSLEDAESFIEKMKGLLACSDRTLK